MSENRPSLVGLHDVSETPSDDDRADPESPMAARCRALLKGAEYRAKKRGNSEDAPVSNIHGKPVQKKLDAITNSAVKEAVNTACNYYIKHYLISKWGNKWEALATLKQRSGHLNHYVEVVTSESHRSFLDANREDFDRYLDSLLKTNPRPKTFSKKVNGVGLFYDHLRRYFDVEVALPGIVFDQFDPEDYENRLSEPFSRTPLTRDEMRRLVAGLGSPRNRLMVRLLYQASLRNSEVRNLKLEHISFDLNDPHVKIKDSKHGKDRKMAILDDLMLDLEHWIDVQRKGVSTYAVESEYVFPSRNGVKIQSNQGLRTIVHEAAEEAGLQGKETVLSDGRTKHLVDVHVLRHTGNDHWADCGITLEDRSELLGHSDEEITENHYPVRENEATDRRNRFRSDFDPAI